MKAAVANQLAAQSGRRRLTIWSYWELGPSSSRESSRPSLSPLCVPPQLFFSGGSGERRNIKKIRAATSPVHGFPLPFSSPEPGSCWLALIDVSTTDARRSVLYGTMAIPDLPSCQPRPGHVGFGFHLLPWSVAPMGLGIKCIDVPSQTLNVDELGRVTGFPESCLNLRLGNSFRVLGPPSNVIVAHSCFPLASQDQRLR